MIYDFGNGRKIIDSAIIGLICFVFMWLAGFFIPMPFALLISVIIGVTNIIPFFGPFIGAIPSTILIMVISPVQALYFVIFVLLLQQFDGNILGPKILGKSTGISSFWVIVAIAAPCFQPFASVLPLFFPRITIYYLQITGK